MSERAHHENFQQRCHGPLLIRMNGMVSGAISMPLRANAGSYSKVAVAAHRYRAIPPRLCAPTGLPLLLYSRLVTPRSGLFIRWLLFGSCTLSHFAFQLQQLHRARPRLRHQSLQPLLQPQYPHNPNHGRHLRRAPGLNTLHRPLRNILPSSEIFFNEGWGAYHSIFRMTNRKIHPLFLRALILQDRFHFLPPLRLSCCSNSSIAFKSSASASIASCVRRLVSNSS